MRSLLPRGPLLLLLAGCATPPEREERVSADRADVTRALYRQLDEVVARRDALEGEPGEEAAAEREELNQLAWRIAERIVRIDPKADDQMLVRRLEPPR